MLSCSTQSYLEGLVSGLPRVSPVDRWVTSRYWVDRRMIESADTAVRKEKPFLRFAPCTDSRPRGTAETALAQQRNVPSFRMDAPLDDAMRRART
jgi:hypothetical protein